MADDRSQAADGLVDYVARAILATWTDSMESDWADAIVRDNRRIEARAAIKAVREWEYPYMVKSESYTTPIPPPPPPQREVSFKTGGGGPVAMAGVLALTLIIFLFLLLAGVVHV